MHAQNDQHPGGVGSMVDVKWGPPPCKYGGSVKHDDSSASTLSTPGYCGEIYRVPLVFYP